MFFVKGFIKIYLRRETTYGRYSNVYSDVSLKEKLKFFSRHLHPGNVGSIFFSGSLITNRQIYKVFEQPRSFDRITTRKRAELQSI